MYWLDTFVLLRMVGLKAQQYLSTVNSEKQRLHERRNILTSKTVSNKTWDSWTDELGNTYKPGDIIAIATISRKSPQMVLAIVERINRVTSSGEEITASKWFDHDEPIQRERV